MNIRPFADKLRQTFGKRLFALMFDSTAGGGGRHVRLAMLFDRDRECDSRRVEAVAGDRWLEINLDECGHSASHFVVTADCQCGEQGPWRMRASTVPTPFSTPDDMLEAIKHELTRVDHPAIGGAS